MNKLIPVICLLLGVIFPVSLRPAELVNATVREVSGDYATIALPGKSAAVGDRAEIYFQISGADVSVAAGEVAEVGSGTARIKITKATGKVSKDQLVRIMASKPVDKSVAGATPRSEASTHATANDSESASIQGDWTADAPHDATVSLSFKDDGNLLWVVTENTSKASHFTHAKYRVDVSQTPNRLELFDIETAVLKDQPLRGIFELQNGDHLKIDLSIKAAENFANGFTKEALVFTRASSPVVIPPGATVMGAESEQAAATTPSATPQGASSAVTSATPEAAPTADASKPPDEQQIEIGDVYYYRRDFDNAEKAYDEAIKLNPRNSWAWRNRGGARVQQDRFKEAIADYEQAIKLDPKRWKDSLTESINNLKK